MAHLLRPVRCFTATLLIFSAAFSHGIAGTNAPYPAGTEVRVAPPSTVLVGTLQDVDAPGWIGVLEDGQSEPTYLRANEIVLRRVSDSEPEIEPGEATPSDDALSPITRRRFGPRSLAPRNIPVTSASTGHYVYGRPEPTDDRFEFKPPGATTPVDGITYHVRTAFTLGHYNRMKVPAWVAIRWTASDLHASNQVSFNRPSSTADTELPIYARTGKDYDFAVTQLERGHMARDADLEAWGFGAVSEGMLMSNMVPQRKGKNHVVWGRLEDEHREIVANSQAGVTTVWIISGPFYDDDNDDGVIEGD